MRFSLSVFKMRIIKHS